MGKIESLNCPGCGAPLHFDNPEQEYCYCSHCGMQVFKEDIHYDRRLDFEENKINKEAETTIADLKRQIEIEKTKRTSALTAIVAVIGIVVILVFVILFV